MDTIRITTPDDLAPALPYLLPYRMAEGSVMVLDFKAEPVANLTPELLAEFDEDKDDLELAKHLDVFKGRNVIIIRAGFHAPVAFVSRALKVAGVDTAYVHSIPMWEVEAYSKHLPSREEYVAKNAATMDISRALSQLVAESRA